MNTRDKLIEKLEDIKNKVKSEIGKVQKSGFKLLTNYYPNDARDVIDDIFVIIESEISDLKKQIEQEQKSTIITVKERLKDLYSIPFNSGYPFREDNSKNKDAIFFLAEQIDHLHKIRIKTK